jgi:hypothetical protein
MACAPLVVGWCAPILARLGGLSLGGLSLGRGTGRGSALGTFLAAHPVTTCGVICIALGGFVLYAFQSDWESRRDWRRAESAVRALVTGALGFCGWGVLMVLAGVVSGR